MNRYNKQALFVRTLISSFLLSPPNVYADQVLLDTSSLSGSLPVKSWKTLRDARVVKQNLDYSCGAASIATVLSEYYQRPTSEKEILELLVKVSPKKGAASFNDMQKILPQLGFKAIGLATSWEQLLSLKIPIIAYVKHHKQDHFTILSGINNTHVKLSDPSLGNRVLTRGQFKEIWETRKQKGLEGKVLAIIPLEKDQTKNANTSFFSNPKYSDISKELLIIQR